MEHTLLHSHLLWGEFSIRTHCSSYSQSFRSARNPSLLCGQRQHNMRGLPTPQYMAGSVTRAQVTHPITSQARRCLTSVMWRELFTNSAMCCYKTPNQSQGPVNVFDGNIDILIFLKELVGAYVSKHAYLSCLRVYAVKTSMSSSLWHIISICHPRLCMRMFNTEVVKCSCFSPKVIRIQIWKPDNLRIVSVHCRGHSFVKACIQRYSSVDHRQVFGIGFSHVQEVMKNKQASKRSTRVIVTYKNGAYILELTQKIKHTRIYGHQSEWLHPAAAVFISILYYSKAWYNLQSIYTVRGIV